MVRDGFTTSPTVECGCVIITRIRGFSIDWCPLHAAAQDLLEAAKRLQHGSQGGVWDEDAMEALEAAIAKAAPPEDLTGSRQLTQRR